MGFFSSIGKIVGVANDFLGSPLGDLGSSVVTGALSSKGAAEANEANIANARETREFNAEEAQKNRDFQATYYDKSKNLALGQVHQARLFSRKERQQAQKFSERMSSSAHQRQVQDLKKAGLNPILSAKYGGASSPPGQQASPGANASVSQPSGNAASASNPAAIIDEITPALHAANQVRRTSADVRKISADIGKVKEENELLRARVHEANSSANAKDQAATLDDARTTVEYERAKNLRVDRYRNIGLTEEDLKTARRKGLIDEVKYNALIKIINTIKPYYNSAKNIAKDPSGVIQDQMRQFFKNKAEQERRKNQ